MVEFEKTIRDVINAHISSDGITIGELTGSLVTITAEVLFDFYMEKYNGEEDKDEEDD